MVYNTFGIGLKVPSVNAAHSSREVDDHGLVKGTSLVNDKRFGSLGNGKLINVT